MRATLILNLLIDWPLPFDPQPARVSVFDAAPREEQFLPLTRAGRFIHDRFACCSFIAWFNRTGAANDVAITHRKRSVGLREQETRRRKPAFDPKIFLANVG